jgi:hypothetical protein
MFQNTSPTSSQIAATNMPMLNACTDDPRPAIELPPRDFDAEDEIEYIKDEMRFERQREERIGIYE